MVFRRVPPPRRQGLANDIAAVSSLDDPVRLAIFLKVENAEEPVSRDQVARALGMTRRVAAFHLDRLAELGLVDVSFKRLTGRAGPGAGRTSKLYRRSGRRLNISLPARNYELMARVVVSAVREAQGASAAHGLKPHARAFGVSIGTTAKKSIGLRASRERLYEALVSELGDRGFEPFADQEGTLRLRNCPYEEMAREDERFVCTMNFALWQGVVAGLGLPDAVATSEPRQGICCVAFHNSPPNDSRVVSG